MLKSCMWLSLMRVAAAIPAVMFAQQSPHPGHGQEQEAMGSTVPEIFCPTLQTGQLCSHGTADALKLTGDKRDRWVAAARRYNAAVKTATARLLADSNGILTPEEQKLVETWFAKGLNPQINQLLAMGNKD